MGEETVVSCALKGFDEDHMGLHNWKKLDTRILGIKLSMVSPDSYTILKILQRRGYEAYLVGGCVRDLILKRIPKHSDVITTASLLQIRELFHPSFIIGQRYPSCKVFIGVSSYVMVSSFEIVPIKDGKQNPCFYMPNVCVEKDILRWRNCMHRDFTINTLFYDPFAHTIYDYSNSLKDIKLSKLRTLIPAELSFKDDRVRILRGLRLAARLNFSFAKETESTIRKLSSSILRLNNNERLLTEVNNMLSYGAAERSLCLLKRYNLLEFLFPFQNAYMTEQSNLKSGHDSMMLMKLLSNLDLFVSCDRPCDKTLWLAILAFHTALIKVPQHALVVLGFASLLYHGNWDEGISYARGHIDAALKYDPEILDSSYYLSDDELAERVTEFTFLIQDSVYIFTCSKRLQKTMANTCSGLVFVSKRSRGGVNQVFQTLFETLDIYIIFK